MPIISNNNYILKNIIVIFITIMFSPFIVLADPMTSAHPVQISAYVNNPVNPPVGGGGGGGVGSTDLSMPTIVNFSGVAYPLSRVYVLKDGNIAVTTIADPGANFSISLSGLVTDSYTFSVYGEDSKGRRSSFFSFPIFITSGTTVNIGNIFISPTIDIDKRQVKKGDNLAIFGQSAPGSEITISVNSTPEYFFKVKSSEAGAYLYNLDTSILDFGNHKTKSKSTLNEQLSQFTQPLSFLVGGSNQENETLLCSMLRGDLNCDGRVNLIDFSIMAYWYKRSNPPDLIDLKKDGKITLVDFSILAFNWTG